LSTPNEALPHNVGHLIERSGDALPAYLSVKVGRDYGSPYGGWVTEKDRATVYDTTEEAQRIIDGPLTHIAPFCRVVPK
jgi:hypothetical protein